MITSIFPNKVLIKDFDLSDDWNNNVTALVKAVFAKELAEKGDYAAAGNDSISLFTEENMTVCPELLELRQMFVDCFYELASSYTTNKLTKEYIEQRVRKDLGKLPFMKKNDFKRVHNHDSMVDAFAIFYLTDLDNEKDGGELILHDPSFSGVFNFHEKRTFGIATKKHRMVVCPNHIWHEVSMYTGEKERATIVLNLNAI
jgi:hypothetical protein